MKINKIITLSLISVLTITALTGCGNKEDAITDVAEQSDYYELVTAEQNYFGMSNKELETIIKAMADYEVCNKVQMKLLNNEELFTEELVENLYSLKELQGIVADCDCDNTEGPCEHELEAERINSELTPVREFDQTQMETWYDGPVALSEMKLNIVTYNVYPATDKELIISIKYYDTDKQLKNIVGIYNNELRLITEVK